MTWLAMVIQSTVKVPHKTKALQIATPTFFHFLGASTRLLLGRKKGKKIKTDLAVSYLSASPCSSPPSYGIFPLERHSPNPQMFVVRLLPKKLSRLVGFGKVRCHYG